MAVLAPNGDPLVSPVDGWFIHGRFYWSSGGESVRIRGLRARPRVSVCAFEREDYAITANGHGELMYAGHPHVAEIDAIFREHCGGGAFDWSDHGVYVLRALRPNHLETTRCGRVG